jgi:hypothetical protein
VCLHAIISYDMEPMTLLPLRRKACCGFFIAHKNPSSRPGLNPLTLGLIASTLTITQPKRLDGRTILTILESCTLQRIQIFQKRSSRYVTCVDISRATTSYQTDNNSNNNRNDNNDKITRAITIIGIRIKLWITRIWTIITVTITIKGITTVAIGTRTRIETGGFQQLNSELTFLSPCF